MVAPNPLSAVFRAATARPRLIDVWGSGGKSTAGKSVNFGVRFLHFVRGMPYLGHGDQSPRAPSGLRGTSLAPLLVQTALFPPSAPGFGRGYFFYVDSGYVDSGASSSTGIAFQARRGTKDRSIGLPRADPTISDQPSWNPLNWCFRCHEPLFSVSRTTNPGATSPRAGSGACGPARPPTSRFGVEFKGVDLKNGDGVL